MISIVHTAGLSRQHDELMEGLSLILYIGTISEWAGGNR
jgi:hypothetical protein